MSKMSLVVYGLYEVFLFCFAPTPKNRMLSGYSGVVKKTLLTQIEVLEEDLLFAENPADRAKFAKLITDIKVIIADNKILNNTTLKIRREVFKGLKSRE